VQTYVCLQNLLRCAAIGSIKNVLFKTIELDIFLGVALMSAISRKQADPRLFFARQHGDI